MADNSRFYFNTVAGLKEMATNVSISAAEIYENFTAIPWIQSFKEKIICDLDFKQRDPEFDFGHDFESPNHCVNRVIGTPLNGNDETELRRQLLTNYYDVLLDNDYQQIAGACATPQQPFINPRYKWYCYFWFVDVNSVANSNCLCETTLGGCCPLSMGIWWYSLSCGCECATIHWCFFIPHSPTRKD